MQASHGITGIMVRELRRLVSRPLYLCCMVAAPLLCCLFFTTLMYEGLPKDMPVGVVDEDNTSTTREILRNMDAFSQVHLTEDYASVSEARRAMQQGKIYAFIFRRALPRRFCRAGSPRCLFIPITACLLPAR